jgi:hypothetical protein
MKKGLIGGALALAAIVFGFIFLLKGCLAKYDERSAIAPALLFERDGKKIILAITKFEKTKSYSRNGGMVRRSVSTSYFIQTNDATSAEFIAEKKIKHQRDIKTYPIEVLGASGDNAWVFIGEPMAFNAFTLGKTADVKLLEEKNPALKDKFPAERQYYSFNKNNRNIYITAKDGSKWQLNTESLLATASNYNKDGDTFENRLEEVEALLKHTQAAQDSNYQLNSRQAAERYRNKEMSYNEYQAISQVFYDKRKYLDKQRDSLWDIKRKLDENKRNIEYNERKIENLQRINPGFSQIKTNQDTAGGIWWGLYDEKEMKDLYDRVSDNTANDETARRNLWMGTYSVSRYNDANIDKASAKAITGMNFLNGGFLLNKQTARPIRIGSKGAFLIVHNDQVGRDGKIQVTLASPGKENQWSINTGLTEWADWIYKSNMLYVFGTDNKELSSSEVNLLLCISLDNGSVSRYDYFKKAMRK